MPLFKHSEPSPPPSARSSTSEPRRSLFSGHRSSVDTDTTSVTTNGTHRSGSRKFFGRGGEDQSVAAARQRLMQAEGAEREADRAKLEASRAVRDAKEHVKRVEAEAAEEARLAKIKQKDAEGLKKRALPLGRHGIA